MKIELKKVKHSPSLSEETEAFTADLHVNGRKVASVRNSGHGGPNDVDWIGGYGGPDQLVFADYLKTLPPKPCSWDATAKPLTINEDFFLALLVEEHLRAKDAAKMAKRIEKQAAKARAKGMVLLVVTQKVNALTRTASIDVRPGPDLEQWKAKLLAKYPGGVTAVYP